MIRIHEQLGASASARGEHRSEVWHDVRVDVQHGGYQHRGGAIINGARQSLGERGGWLSGHLHDLDPFFRQTVELASDRMELAVASDQPRPLAQRQRREEPHHQLVGVRREGNALWGVIQEARKPLAHGVRLGERPLPHIVY